MEHQFIRDMKQNETVRGVYGVGSLELPTIKTGQRKGDIYLRAQLSDKSGSIGVIMWETDERLRDAIAEVSYIRVEGRVGTYNGQPQLALTLIDPVDEDDVDKSLLVAATDRDVDEMLEKVRALCDAVTEPHLKALLGVYLEDEKLVDLLKRAPAAHYHHHAFLGGLLEHTLGVMELADEIAGRYAILDHDLLVTGAFLHDLGKMQELDAGDAFEYTDEGKLIGHVALGALGLARAVRDIEGFPRALFDRVCHLVLSHHGQREWGAPVVPATAEAVALHHIENLDAKMNGFKLAMERDATPGSWTGYVRMFETRLFRGEEPGDV